MDGLFLLIGFLVLLLLVGAVCGLLAMSRLSALEQDLRKQRHQVQALEQRLLRQEARVLPLVPVIAATDTPSPPEKTASSFASATAQGVFRQAPVSDSSSSPDVSSAPQRDALLTPATGGDGIAPSVEQAKAPSEPPSEPVATKPERLERDIASRWMVWVGGVALALGGVFLVKFGVEHSVLGPSGRVIAGLVLGLVLILTSEWLRQRDVPLEIPRLGAQADYVPAALAGGGVIAWYASLLTAFDLYGLIPPGMAFVLLGVVSLLAMALSLLQGPLLAVLGLLGGYLVPALVSTGHGSLSGLLCYVALVSLAALALQYRVQRRWLWWGTWCGHFIWFVLAWSLYRDETLFLLGYFLSSLYAFMALPGFGWRLQSRALRLPCQWRKCPAAVKDAYWVALAGSVLLVGLMQFLHYPLSGWLALLLLLVGAQLLARRIVALDLLPWLAAACLLLIVLLFSLPLYRVAETGWAQLAPSELWPLWRWGMGLAVLQTLLALQWLTRARRGGLWGSLLVVTPLLMLALLYWRSPVGSEGFWTDQSLSWPLQGLVLFVVFTALAEVRHRWSSDARVALLAGGQGALALAFIMVLADAELTLALALQLAGLARLGQREGDRVPHWLIKVLAMIIVARLSLNPWLLDYAQTGRLGVHWSLYGYGIPVLCFFLAARWLPQRPGASTNAWLEAGAVQLLTLWLTLEGRYWLSGGDPWNGTYGLADTALSSVTWGALALIYGWKARLNGALARVYALASPLLLSLMMVMTVLGSTLRYNPLWVSTSVGEWPVLNLTLVAWGIPALISLLALGLGTYPSWLRRGLSGFLFSIGMLYLTLMVRQWWQGGDLSGFEVPDGEQYTYSAIWLLAAITLMLLGGWLAIARVRQAALLVLLITVLKIFLWDMADLEGLYRAASFLGLGGCLVGLGWFYQHHVLPLAGNASRFRHHGSGDDSIGQ
jgi:uncharacterized membrane protein